MSQHRMIFRYACGDEGATLVSPCQESETYDALEQELCPRCKRAAREDGLTDDEYLADQPERYDRFPETVSRDDAWWA